MHNAAGLIHPKLTHVFIESRAAARLESKILSNMSFEYVDKRPLHVTVVLTEWMLLDKSRIREFLCRYAQGR